MGENFYTRRLDLILLRPALLEAFITLDYGRAGRLGGLQVPEGVEFEGSVFARRLLQIQEDPLVQPWLLRAIVERESGMMCGRIGFHSAPAPPYLRDYCVDGVEMGYEIAPPFRRRGYAREAVVGLMHWAFAEHMQRSFVLSISPSNVASLALAAFLGFEEIGTAMDEEDGLEIVFARRLDDWPSEWNDFLMEPADSDRSLRSG